MRSTLALVALVLSGCASDPEPRSRGVLTVATVRDNVLVGFSTPLGDGGAFELQSVYGLRLTCEGRFRYQPFPTGTASFDCSDGQKGRIRIRAEGYLTGEGHGDSDMGEVHVVYGYSIDEINEILTLPTGTRLVHDERGVGLVRVEDQ